MQSYLKNKFPLILLISLAAALGIFHYAMKEKPTGKELKRMQESYAKSIKWIGKFPPDFEIDFLNGETFILSENIGKRIIILNFFATWCGPCRQEMPELNHFYLNHESDPFILIGITDEEDKKLLEKFITDQELDFPVGIDKNSRIAKKYGVESVPTTVFIGVDGRILLYEVGAIANADVAFRFPYKANMDSMKDDRMISKEDYLKEIGTQEGIRKLKSRGVFEHNNRAAQIAERIICPFCNRPLIDCDDEFSIGLKSKLLQMDLENKSDEEILKELFLVKPEEQ